MNGWLGVKDNMSFKVSDYKGERDTAVMRRAIKNRIDDEVERLENN